MTVALVCPQGDRQTTEAGLVWTRHQKRISVNDCATRHARGRSLSRPSEEMLYRQCERMDIPQTTTDLTGGGSLCSRHSFPPNDQTDERNGDYLLK
ncbi:hypothetical protein DPMN_165483 [Dreissena polymorpha]|uniref:Uncharacterized protein n=1 Tax=Dreissena polymorpha TaxID=45954 RepID=A0A9D4EUX0_DREPO|nr:hypothetical protein DPMN_165483 [Dreissena polymorpha]